MAVTFLQSNPPPKGYGINPKICTVTLFSTKKTLYIKLTLATS